MNVIEVMKQVLTDYPKISELISEEVHIDFTEEQDKSYGLSSTGDSLVKKDILGNQTRANNMVLYAVNQSTLDYERLQNSSFLLDLGYYLETLSGMEITATINDSKLTGYIDSITVANGMAYTISEDGQYITYQIQIRVVYKLESEEW